jgi:hypothetical protein
MTPPTTAAALPLDTAPAVEVPRIGLAQATTLVGGGVGCAPSADEAEATIDGDSVIVQSAEVPQPLRHKRLRYDFVVNLRLRLQAGFEADMLSIAVTVIRE